jgi:hypothetical protein
MPDPLMGFALQSVPPPVQPYAVSGAVALLSLGILLVLPERWSVVASTEAPRQTSLRSNGRAAEASLAYRALLHTRVRHLDSTG